VARKFSLSKSLELCREKGWDAWIVESRNPYAGKTYDLFGFGDVLAMTDDGIMAIQACGEDVMTHIRKMTEDPDVVPYLRRWLSVGGQVELWAWRRRKKKLAKGWSKRKYFRLTRYGFEAAPGGVHWWEIEG
jgi:hypothetical protein